MQSSFFALCERSKVSHPAPPHTPTTSGIQEETSSTVLATTAGRQTAASTLAMPLTTPAGQQTAASTPGVPLTTPAGQQTAVSTPATPARCKPTPEEILMHKRLQGALRVLLTHPQEGTQVEESTLREEGGNKITRKRNRLPPRQSGRKKKRIDHLSPEKVNERPKTPPRSFLRISYSTRKKTMTQRELERPRVLAKPRLLAQPRLLAGPRLIAKPRHLVRPTKKSQSKHRSQ